MGELFALFHVLGKQGLLPLVLLFELCQLVLQLVAALGGGVGLEPVEAYL